MFSGLRKTSRVIVLEPTGRVLLLLTRAPDSSNWRRWVTPGGGVDPGESHHSAAVRELAEETGLTVEELGPPVFSQEIPLPYDEAIYPGAYQEFFVARVPQPFEPDSTGWTDSERIDVTDWRWWSIDELVTTEEPFEPRELPELMRTLLSREDTQG